MRHAVIADDPKGWLAGPWDGSAPLPIGYATEAIDEPHFHTSTTEIFLVAAGTATARVERQDVALRAGDVLILEPGEAHTFLTASADYLAFVLHATGDGSDKQPVDRSNEPTSSADASRSR